MKFSVVKFPLLGIGVMVVAFAVVAACWSLSEDTRYIALWSAYASSSALGIWLQIRAALAFGPGDRMRRGWGVLAVSSMFPLGTLAVGSLPFHDSVAQPIQLRHALIFAILTLLLNLTSLYGLSIFVRAWRATGLAPPWLGRAAILALAVGAIIAGPSTWHDLQEIWNGPRHPWDDLISDICDIAAVTFTGPLLASAIWMRGGALVWPYLYLAANGFAWLLYDAGGHLPVAYARISDMFFAMLGILFTAAAAQAHRMVVKRTS